MSSAQLTLKSVQELLSEKFFVPAYQRGYRWSSEEVNDLLKDLNEFRQPCPPVLQNTEHQPFYCLQPVVVKKTEDDLWEVIDGQQRLTTILLILHYFNETEFKQPKPIYQIDYATRGHSSEFLRQLESETFRFENVDYYHLHEAYQTIKSWFAEKEITNSAIQNEMYPVFTNRVEIIWYDISETNESAIEVFTRLNVGKIPLTNAELIKALFLRKDNFEHQSAHLKQIQIASEWDAIETTLQRKDFWFFIYNKENPIQYDTRIEFIFDLMYGRKPNHQERYTYNQFSEQFKNLERRKLTQKIDASWQQVKRYYLTLEQWYRDPKWYHLIGYLVATGESLKELKEASLNTTKNQFEAHVHSRIREKVNFSLDELDFSRDKQKIRNVLLLFNIQTILNSEAADVRFPFHRLKDKQWDIEHIASQTEASIRSTKQRKDWIADVVDYLCGKSIDSFENELQLTESMLDEINGVGKLLWENYHKEKIEDEAFNPMRSKIERHFKEDSLNPEYMHGIGNLALLDDETNRSYKNAMFPIKRKRIIKNDSTGVMVPLCTKNVFMKFYSNRLSEVMYWQDADIQAYVKAIKTTLQEYLPQEPENE
ncbi:DUF262 domain-containing protein [Catalinimonas niigatensis]|uniref:DUF262 domain-containing protein n=1 Tax=Catalinimonas niigatensis TaxID=1397264 RepID=UPI002667110D|nr:DUF262 domain-containing protein [Catalinimonas niigatensis]WPP48936.1 DUF262 domain-containing protein [Catalinimonas niigatensis]